MSYRTILVPIDFSAHAERALDAAMEFAKPSKATLQLLYVCHLPVQVAMPEMAMVPPNVWEDMRESGKKRLAEHRRRVEEAGLECHAHVSEGLPSQTILSAATRLEADLIVMGTRGLSGLKHVMLGSVAERTLRLAECPVITVHADQTSGAFRLRTVLVPVDFSPASDRALELAADLAKIFGSVHLILAHGYYIPVDLEQFLVQKQGPPLLEQITGGVTEGLEKILTGLQDRGISSEYIADRANPEHLIVDLARSKDVDMIVMGTHGRRGLPRILLGSVAERVVRTAPCAVLTVHPGGDAQDQKA